MDDNKRKTKVPLTRRRGGSVSPATQTRFPVCVSDESVPLVGAGDRHGDERPEGGAVDLQPD